MSKSCRYHYGNARTEPLCVSFLRNELAKLLTGPTRSSRRRFTKTVAAWILALPLGSSVARAQKTPPSATKQAPAPPTPPASTPQQPSPAAEAYTEVIRLRYGNRITPDELTRIKRDIEANLRSAERLSAYKLKNGDEPDFIFSA